MAKTNFTKVEEALNEGLRKIEVNKLLDTADIVSGKGEAVATSKEASGQRQLLIALQLDLKLLHKELHDAHGKISISQANIKEFLTHPDQLTPEDWEEVRKAKKYCDELKEEQAKKEPSSANEDIVSKERRKHINKRFNVNEKWLPLR